MKKALFTFFAAVLMVGIATIAQAKPISEMNVDISGLGQFGYAWSEAGAFDNGFDTNRLRIKINAQPEEHIAFYTALEGTDNISGGAFGSNVPSNANIADMAADSRLIDMKVTLTYWPWVTILAGQMPTPVSYELNTDEYDLETINYSQFIGIANRDRGVGFLFPLHPEVKVATWILNGTGSITGGNTDMDDRSNYGALISYTPMETLNVKGFLNLAQMADDTNVIAPTGGQLVELDADAWGLGADYKWCGFHFMGEYVKTKLKLTNEASGARIAFANGSLSPATEEWYLHGSYLIPKTDLQLVARYDKYDPDTTGAATSDDTKITTAGLNWNFEKNSRLQIMREFKSGFVKDDDLDVQLSVRF